MNEIKKLNKKYKKSLKKVSKVQKEIYEMLSYMLAHGTGVRITKKLAYWYKENGEDCGVPSKQIKAILKRPVGTVEDFVINGDDVDIKLKFDLPDLDYLRVGFEDIE